MNDVAVTSLRTLVLNADFRPLSTWPLSLIPAPAAVSTVWRDRANVIEAWPNRFFHSPSTTLPVPKVIALREYAPVASKPKFCRRSILLRDRFRCQYCGKQFTSDELTFDHVIPRAKGGKTEWTNILMACVKCNAGKRDQSANYSGRKGAGMFRPLKEPRIPTTAELLRAGLEFLDSEVRETFGEWLYWETPLRA
jgi:5-methylcytosine-specific restriction endonuclease McrA